MSCMPCFCRGRYLLPSHYSMVMLEQPPPPGCSGPPYLQMHLASVPVTLVMNNPNYTALLAFCEGNLQELSAMPNAQNQPDGAKPQNTTFAPDFRFGPPVGVPPTFRMTLDIPEFQVNICFWRCHVPTTMDVPASCITASCLEHAYTQCKSAAAKMQARMHITPSESTSLSVTKSQALRTRS